MTTKYIPAAAWVLDEAVQFVCDDDLNWYAHLTLKRLFKSDQVKQCRARQWIDQNVNVAAVLVGAVKDRAE